MDNVKDKGQEFFRVLIDLGTDYALSVVGGIIVAVLAWIAASFLQKGVERLLLRSRRVEATVARFLARLARYTVLALAVVVVLGQFGVQTASIIAALGAAGIAIALALQGTLSNIAAGVVLLLLRPFRIGDYIDAEGIAGTVDELGLMTTRMRTIDGLYLEVPNNQLWNRAIRNYTRLPVRRVDVAIGVSYEDDIDRALGILMAVAQADSRVLREPATQAVVTGLGDSAVNLALRCWIANQEFFDVQSDLIRAAKRALEIAGFTIPFPQREVRLVERRADADRP
jgi:small conductance mechanosensitive channel